ncbi:multiple epidermal growth factor-like domains protein 6 [Pollicipes pollicipes]|uniref:multiple epidermal growth factor-like domains protein 6 n=1 Tax=Pollicipes pollicipes TaxID=41117 RepID=UPI001884DA39|nr:multiple epidermal growth factor-like domains protein 6 [Pollicipes pollicipes]
MLRYFSQKGLRNPVGLGQVFHICILFSRPHVCEYKAIEYQDHDKPKISKFRHRGLRVFRYEKVFRPRHHTLFICCAGWARSDTEGCVIDWNECDRDNGGCSHDCLNTPGSFLCTCPHQMRLAGDGRRCLGASECLNNNGGCAHICDDSTEEVKCRCHLG